MTNQQPRPDDAVLGGQSQGPLDAAILGGIQAVRQKLASDNEAVKKEGVLQALNYGEKGIEALFGVLEQERNLNIQWLAHQTLAKQGNPVIEARLKNYFPWYEYQSVTVNRQGEIVQRTPGRARYYREDLGNGVYLDMVYIAGGSFLMGAPESEHESFNCERPQYQVTVPDFWMGKYQVTQAQWQAVTGYNWSKFKGENRPVENVSWYDCQRFCGKLSVQARKQYRLPSEAEWEYACRAGTTTPFNCGETITTDLANYDAGQLHNIYAEERRGNNREETLEVGSFQPNAWGLYDMHGNVFEWCEDNWYDDYQAAPIDGSPRKYNLTENYYYDEDIFSVIRGGSWDFFAGGIRSASRLESHYGDMDDGIGFRLVMELDRALGPAECGT